MTTSTLRIALQHALTTLVDSLPSSDGSPLSPIDDLETAEERLAARLAQRLHLRPPVDVEMVANSLATVSEKSFPMEIDGLCLDLKAIAKKPKIWISKKLGHVRRRFTLAHEIGHIIIPWHVGSIVDDLEAGQSGALGKYRQTEAEANRFASELLIPTAWVKDLARRADHITGLMHTVIQQADVSFQAALFKTTRLGPSGYIGAVVKDGIIIWSGRTKGTWSRPPVVGTRFDLVDMPAARAPQSIYNGDTGYHWWEIINHATISNDTGQEWRDILEVVLGSIPNEKRAVVRSRVNAIVGYAIGKFPKGTAAEILYARALEATQNRSDQDTSLVAAISHSAFRDYLLSRACERANSQ